MPATIASKPSHTDPSSEELFPYETLSYAGRLEFLDRTRTVAVFKRQQMIRVIAPRLTVFLDRIWGEGVLFADYWTGGLPIVEAVRGKSGWVAILELPRSYRKGDIVQIRTERRIVGGFTQAVEHWDTTMFAPTKWLSLEICGAAAKHVRWPRITSPARAYPFVAHDSDSLRLVVRQPQADERYRLHWSWK
jgi:hypothetical protein